MNEANLPADDILAGIRADRDALVDAQYETNRVKYVLKQCNLLKIVGHHHLDTFEQFREVFPSFPIALGANRLPGIKLHAHLAAIFPALFKTFHRVPFVPPYRMLWERITVDNPDAPVGLIFPRKGFQAGMLIYNYIQGVPEEDILGTVLTHFGEHITLHVRPLAVVIAAIYNGGKGWKP